MPAELRTINYTPNSGPYQRFSNAPRRRQSAYQNQPLPILPEARRYIELAIQGSHTSVQLLNRDIDIEPILETIVHARENLEITQRNSIALQYKQYYYMGEAIDSAIQNQTDPEDELLTQIQWVLSVKDRQRADTIYNFFKAWPSAIKHMNLPLRRWDQLVDEHLLQQLQEETEAAHRPEHTQQAIYLSFSSSDWGSEVDTPEEWNEPNLPEPNVPQPPLQELPQQEVPLQELPQQEVPLQELPQQEVPLQELPEQELLL